MDRRALVDRGLVDEADLGHHDEDHAGLYVGYASCEPERVPDITRAILDILRDVRESGLTDDEIDRAKQKTASAAVLRSETPMGRLVPVGSAWVYRHEYTDIDESIDRLLSVTSEDVKNVLSRYPLDPHTYLGLGPIDGLDAPSGADD